MTWNLSTGCGFHESKYIHCYHANVKVFLESNDWWVNEFAASIFSAQCYCSIVFFPSLSLCFCSWGQLDPCLPRPDEKRPMRQEAVLPGPTANMVLKRDKLMEDKAFSGYHDIYVLPLLLEAVCLKASCWKRITSVEGTVRLRSFIQASDRHLLVGHRMLD